MEEKEIGLVPFGDKKRLQEETGNPADGASNSSEFFFVLLVFTAVKLKRMCLKMRLSVCQHVKKVMIGIFVTKVLSNIRNDIKTSCTLFSN